MKRILTAAVAIPIVVLLTLYSSDWLFALVIGLVAALAAGEFLSLSEHKGIARPGLWFVAPAGMIAAAFYGGASWVLTATAGAAILLMTVSIFSKPLESALSRVAMGLSALVYCSMTLGFLVLIPRELILLLMAIIWVGDMFAYYGGRTLGRRLLAPAVSPKKTVEGAIAGLIGSIAVGVFGAMWLLGEPALTWVWISAVTAVTGQFGDLAESVLKRSAGVKDSSSVLPGHGGILDRLDSLFFAAPVFYWLLNA
jgi:phosphatidate cytidylyltransferase